MTLFAIEEAIRALVAYFSGRTVPGWTSLMILVSMSNAALLITIGILGEYVAKIFEESKGRPLYIVADTWNVAERFEPALTARSIDSLHHTAASEQR